MTLSARISILDFSILDFGLSFIGSLYLLSPRRSAESSRRLLGGFEVFQRFDPDSDHKPFLRVL
jgi:hypothetical protein